VLTAAETFRENMIKTVAEAKKSAETEAGARITASENMMAKEEEIISRETGVVIAIATINTAAITAIVTGMDGIIFAIMAIITEDGMVITAPIGIMAAGHILTSSFLTPSGSPFRWWNSA
jgi:hypothetical protein